MRKACGLAFVSRSKTSLPSASLTRTKFTLPLASRRRHAGGVVLVQIRRKEPCSFLGWRRLRILARRRTVFEPRQFSRHAQALRVPTTPAVSRALIVRRGVRMRHKLGRRVEASRASEARQSGPGRISAEALLRDPFQSRLDTHKVLLCVRVPVIGRAELPSRDLRPLGHANLSLALTRVVVHLPAQTTAATPC